MYNKCERCVFELQWDWSGFAGGQSLNLVPSVFFKAFFRYCSGSVQNFQSRQSWNPSFYVTHCYRWFKWVNLVKVLTALNFFCHLEMQLADDKFPKTHLSMTVETLSGNCAILKIFFVRARRNFIFCSCSDRDHVSIKEFKIWRRQRQRQRHKSMIWLVEWRRIIVLHPVHRLFVFKLLRFVIDSFTGYVQVTEVSDQNNKFTNFFE